MADRPRVVAFVIGPRFNATEIDLWRSGWKRVMHHHDLFLSPDGDVVKYLYEDSQEWRGFERPTKIYRTPGYWHRRDADMLERYAAAGLFTFIDVGHDQVLREG